MRTKTIKIYKFDELSDTAKEKARQWYREDIEIDTERMFDDIAYIAGMFGLDIGQTIKVNPDKSSRWLPTIYYSGFGSQGDGACFEGTYQYKKGALKAVKKECPNDTELHRIVEQLQYEQARYSFAVTAKISHRGFYYHSGCMSIDIEHCYNRYQDVDKFDTDLFRDFADWIYKRLENEWGYQNSDAVIDENIICNEYEFTENGNGH